MPKLSGVERILKALRLEEPDTVPTFELVIDQKVRDGIKPGLSYEDFCEFAGLDAVCYHELKTDRFEVIDEGKRLYRDQWGGIQQFSAAGDMPVPREPAIKTAADIAGYVGPDPDRPDRFKTIEEAVKRFKGKKAIIAGVRPFASVKDSLRSESLLFRDMVKNPGLVDDLNRIVDDYYMRYIRNLIDVGVDAVIETADWAITQGPMISPELTGKFIIPILGRFVDYCHRQGVPCLKHSDGNLWPIMDLIVGTGIDGLHPIDPLAGMDIGEVKEKYGDKLCLMGNIDCGDLLSTGTPDDVRRAVKECFRKAGQGGGYICMSSNSIHGAVIPENYAAMLEAIREYGRYPLSLD